MANAQAAYNQLIQAAKDYTLLGTCAGVLGWDERTYMPRRGSAHRAEQMALMARLTHGMLTDPNVGEWLTAVENSDLVKDPAGDVAVNVRETRRAYNRAVKLPKTLVEELARTTTRAQQIWQEARQEDDFKKFQPWLEKIVSLKRQEAAAVGFTGAPYDALLDEYEPGALTCQVTKTFAALRDQLSPLVHAIRDSGRQPRRDILEREYPVDRQQFFGQAAAAAIGFDFASGRLDITTHPFCSGLGPGDTRLTTRYSLRHFNDAFFGTLHEAGHGIYEQGLNPEKFGTPLGAAVSLGIHESQSRLWENLVGRGRPFWEHFFPRAQQVFLDALRDVSLDDFYFAVNDVRPSFIRVEADEATYNLHIILRFELEQAILSGDLAAGDVPSAWNEKFKKSLGLSPPTHALGCLQDVHWSMGGIGYFPTYALGNMYAAQFMEKARQDVGNLDGDFQRGDFTALRSWLRRQIHQHGQRFRPGELCQRITGRTLSHEPLVRYLRAKYSPLYGLN